MGFSQQATYEREVFRNIGFLKQLRDFELELGCEALSLPFDAEACRDLLDLELTPGGITGLAL